MIGKEIGKEKEFSLEKVAVHLELVHPNEKRLDSNYIWSLVDWVNPSGSMCVSSKQGILNTYLHIPQEKRRYILEAPKKPWELIICSPAHGLITGLWIVPIGMGVLGNEGNFLGTLTAGIDVNRMNQKIDQALKDLPVQFLVVDKETQIAFASFLVKNSPSSLLASNLIGNFDCFKNQKREQLNPINEEEISFFYYEAIENSPYFLFIGIDQKVLKGEFYLAVIPKLIELFCVMLFCLLILTVFWEKQVLPLIKLSSTLKEILICGKRVKIPKQHSDELQKIGYFIEHYSLLVEEKEKNLHLFEHSLQQIDEKNKEIDQIKHRSQIFIEASSQSEKADEHLLYRLDERLSISFEETISLADILWHNLSGALDSSLSSDEKISIVEKILHRLNLLKEKLPDSLILSAVDVISIIEQSVNIYTKKALIRNVEIKTDLYHFAEAIVLDELLFQQLIIALISKAFYNVSDGAVIQITAASKTIDDRLFLEVVFEDDGFGLEQEDISRLENSFKEKGVSLLDFKNTSFETIEKIVELLGATMQFDSKWQEGTTITLLFPCDLYSI